MAGFRVSKNTRRWQRVTSKEVEQYKDKILLHLSHNKTRLMTVMDIAREVASDYKNETEVARVARIIRNMENLGQIARNGGRVKSYWSQIVRTAKIEPTYKPPTPVEDEEDETEEQPQETQTDTTEEQPVVETEKVNIPVQRPQVIQDVIPVRHQPVHVDRTPRRITITIDL